MHRRRNHEFRKAKYIAAALSSSERNVLFLHKEVVHGHSGIHEMLLDARKEQKPSDHVEVMRTRILAVILDEHSEGAEYDILSSFPFYRFWQSWR